MLLRHRALSLALVLVIGFLLLVSLVLSAVISGVSSRAEQVYALPGWVWQAINLAASFVVIGLLIALMFKYLPDARISWRHVWIGAAVTAVLFTIGKFAIGLYLGRASVGSSYGAAGSVVVLMVWIYYAALILFLGAEITQVYARHSGERIEPEPYARRVSGHAPPAGA
jgi:membrane protein